MDETKPIAQSKTIWFNVVGAVLTTMEAFTGAFQSVMGTQAYLALLAVSVGGNAILRFYTSQPISNGK